MPSFLGIVLLLSLGQDDHAQHHQDDTSAAQNPDGPVELTGLDQAAGVERVMDLSYLEENHHQIRESYMEYILPLIGTLPEYVELKKIGD